MTQFLRDQASDSEEVDTPLMLDGTYLSRNFATLGPLPDSRRVTLPKEHLATKICSEKQGYERREIGKEKESKAKEGTSGGCLLTLFLLHYS